MFPGRFKIMHSYPSLIKLYSFSIKEIPTESVKEKLLLINVTIYIKYYLKRFII